MLNQRSLVDPPWRLEAGLADRVLDEVRVGGVVIGAAGQGQVTTAEDHDDAYETAHLQLVMERLWSAEGTSPEHELRLNTLTALGGADGIVRSHLGETLAVLGRRQRDVAARAFVHLVTPSGTKIAHGVDDLAKYAVPPRQRSTRCWGTSHPARAGSCDRCRRLPTGRVSGGTRSFTTRSARRSRSGANATTPTSGFAVSGAAGHWSAPSPSCSPDCWRSPSCSTDDGRRRPALEQESIARSERMATEAIDEINDDPAAAAEFALRAWEARHTSAAEDSLRQVSSNLLVERALVGHTGALTSGVLSPDGSVFLTTSEDGTARLWPLGGGEPIELLGHDGTVDLGRFSDDGTRVVTIGADHTARVWDAGTGALLSRIDGPEAGFRDVQFAASGTSLVAMLGGRGGTRVYDVNGE